MFGKKRTPESVMTEGFIGGFAGATGMTGYGIYPTAKKVIVRYIIIDTNPYAWAMYNEIDVLLSRTKSWQDTWDWMPKEIYHNVLRELVVLMGCQPADAVERLKYIPSSTAVTNIANMLDHDELNNIVLMIQKHLIDIYMKIAPQFVKNGSMEYILEQFGLDYIVVAEIGTVRV